MIEQLLDAYAYLKLSLTLNALLFFVTGALFLGKAFPQFSDQINMISGAALIICLTIIIRLLKRLTHRSESLRKQANHDFPNQP